MEKLKYRASILVFDVLSSVESVQESQSKRKLANRMGDDKAEVVITVLSTDILIKVVLKVEEQMLSYSHVVVLVEWLQK